jgi:peptide deformylase
MSAHLEFNLNNLHERCEEVNPLDAKSTVLSLTAKLKKYEDIYALSAPQIGIKQRVVCIKYKDGIIKEYINPVPLKAEEFHFVREKDISIPEKEFIAARPTKITLRYQSVDAKPEENILKGAVAEVFDRMMMYLDGVTLDEFGLEVDEEFDDASKEDKDKILDMYIKSLKNRESILNDNIEHDEDAKELKDAIRFMEAVDKGEVTLGDPSLLIDKK